MYWLSKITATSNRLGLKVSFFYKEQLTTFRISWADFNALGYTEETFLKVVPQRLIQNAENFDIELIRWLETALKKKPLLVQDPETLNKNVTRSAELLGIDKKVFILAALKQPQLFSQKPETLTANVKRSAALLNISATKFILAALKHPQLFYQLPETINQNIEDLANLLKLSKAQVVEMALRLLSLFYQCPQTIFNNFKGLQVLFGSEEAALAQAVQYPVYLSLSQERILMHYFVRKLVGKRTDPKKDPIIYLKKYHRQNREVLTWEGLEKLKKIFSVFEMNNRNRRKEARQSVY